MFVAASPSELAVFADDLHEALQLRCSTNYVERMQSIGLVTDTFEVSVLKTNKFMFDNCGSPVRSCCVPVD